MYLKESNIPFISSVTAKCQCETWQYFSQTSNIRPDEWSGNVTCPSGTAQDDIFIITRVQITTHKEYAKTYWCNPN